MTEETGSGAAASGAVADRFHIVGVGASAGGLDALESLFDGMSPTTGMAFVVIQHLSPDFKSHMVELLARRTTMHVQYAVDGVTVAPNSVYLIPPKKDLVISDRTLRLSDRDGAVALALPIDDFLSSLAHDVGTAAVGVILSGTGSDGSMGVRAIHAAHGLVIAQDDDTAQFASMPENARATGCVHVVAAPERVGEVLEQYCAGDLDPGAFARQVSPVVTKGIERIFELIRELSGVDFALYKTSTIGRRLERRMNLAEIDDVDAYINVVQADPVELQDLFQDMLIGVTRFFRDVEAFHILETQVIPALVEQSISTSKPLRMWIPGCASGEEPYSIAMLIDEAVSRAGADDGWKLFATDIHEGSLRHAANGVYNESALEELSEARRARYFQKRPDGYHVDKALRDHLLFARHNVISDAPFTQLDMVSCRNLLIYFQTAAQMRAISFFHFALRKDGIMVLGPSETPGDLTDEFDTVNGTWRVYRKRRDVRLAMDTRLTVPGGASSLPRAARAGVTPAPVSQDAQLMRSYDRLLEVHMPPAILVDESMTLIHAFAGASSYLSVRDGRISNNVLDMVDDGLRTPIAGAIQHALRGNKPALYTGVKVGEGLPTLSMQVRPLRDPSTNITHVAIEFGEEAAVAPHSGDNKSLGLDAATLLEADTLRTELRLTRENLQATIEELETSNEELQAANEEMVASNEELQSTNEELQSVNEELHTVNSEHQRKIEALAESNSDMDNLLAATGVGVIFLDESLSIRRFTPHIARIFSFMPQDVGRPISAFGHLLREQNVEADCRDALQMNREIERDFVDKDGVNYLVRIAPYVSRSESAGIVMTLVNVDRLKQTQASLETFRRMSVDAQDGHVLIAGDQRILYSNDAYGAMSGWTPEELKSMQVSDIVAPDFLSTISGNLQRTSAPSSAPLESEHVRKDGLLWPVEVSLSPVMVDGNQCVFAAVRDITGRRKDEQLIALYNRAMDVTLNGVTIAEASGDCPLIYANHGFETLTGYSNEEVLGRNCRFLQGQETDTERSESISAALRRGEPIRTTLLNYRKSGESFWNDLTISPILDLNGEATHFVGIQHDITESMRQALSLAQRSAEVTSLLESTSDGILGLDSAGLCTFSNTATARLLGYDRVTDLVGQPMHEMIHHSHADGSEYPRDLSPIIQALAIATTNRIDDEVFWRQDGTPLAVEYNCDPITVGDEAAGAVVTFRDIEAKRKRAQLLEQAKEDAEAASRAKSEFLANMSHEIRTPLAAVMGFVDLLQTKISDEEQQGFLGTIKRNVYYLLDIINDILDLSKIEADRVEDERHPLDLPRLLGDLHSVFAMRANEAELGFSVICQTSIPASITTNVTQLRQILLNLLANALKFTQHGRVDLIVKATAKQLEVRIRDTGIGMNEATQSIIFDAFARGSSVPSTIRGTGLGLNISRRLAERLGGTLDVRSREGDGSEFTLRLPIVVDAAVRYVRPNFTDPSIAVNNAVARDEDLAALYEGKLVLVVDDQPDLLAFGERIFIEAGAKVTTATDGQAALASITAKGASFDLVLLDMQLPKLSGFEVVQAMRARGDHTPVIAVTAGAMKGERERCLEAGCNDFLAKPVEATALLEAGARMMERAAEVDHVLRVLVVEDHEDAAAAMAALLEAAGFDVRVGHTGAAARALFHGFAPDVCIIDHHLPDETGTELRRALERDATGERPYFILASGAAHGSEVAAFKAAGFDDVFEKPVDFTRLVDSLSAQAAKV